MKAHIKLGRLFGIQIGLHYSWALIALLITVSLAAHFRSVNAAWGGGVIWTAAVVTGVLFFAAIIAHELAHALVARRRGLAVHSISLFALGGVAQIEREAEDAPTEFWVGVAGPLMSVLIGAACLALALLMGWAAGGEPATPALAVLVWLGYINLGLAVFNLIPAFPLDGGRVLRAAVWWATGSARRATRVATVVGQIAAVGFILYGFFTFFTGSGFSGLWLAMIGWFLLSSARATYVRQELAEGLRGVRVGDLMARELPTVEPYTNLQTFVEEHLLKSGARCFLVPHGEDVAGVITPQEVKNVPRNRWPYTTVDDVMVPVERLRAVTPEMPVEEALELIGREQVSQLPVVSGGRLAGVISRERVLRFLATREELHL
jgi:Zn-dependent protease/predicted transcriptional regulator